MCSCYWTLYISLCKWSNQLAHATNIPVFANQLLKLLRRQFLTLDVLSDFGHFSDKKKEYSLHLANGYTIETV